MKPGNLPIPYFTSIAHHYQINKRGEYDVLVLICPDRMSGRANRYSVLRLEMQTGQMTCVGRELPLGHAHRVARENMVNTPDKPKKTAKNNWFARCRGIAKMGPFDSQVQAAQAIMTTKGEPAEGAFIWPEEAKTPRKKQTAR